MQRWHGTKDGTTAFEAAGAGIKATVDSVVADGIERHWTYTASFDGKDNPIVGNATQGVSAGMGTVR